MHASASNFKRLNNPTFPTTQLPNNPTSQQPNFPTTQLPNNPTSQQPNFPTTQLPNNPTSQQPNFPTTQLPNNPTSQQPNFPTTQLPNSTFGYIRATLSYQIQEWVNLAIRWTHVFAGIMWIGQTYFFTWLDRTLHREGNVWMVHSGGFYVVGQKGAGGL